MIMDEEPDMSPSEEYLIDAKLIHINRKKRRELKKMLLGKRMIALSVHDLRPSEVPVEHDFELKNDEPIYHKIRRMSTKHNTKVKEEIEKML